MSELVDNFDFATGRYKKYILRKMMKHASVKSRKIATSFFTKLSELLQKYDAIIAGGSVCKGILI
jgi:phospholipid N-methyltransferase